MPCFMIRKVPLITKWIKSRPSVAIQLSVPYRPPFFDVSSSACTGSWHFDSAHFFIFFLAALGCDWMFLSSFAFSLGRCPTSLQPTPLCTKDLSVVKALGSLVCRDWVSELPTSNKNKQTNNLCTLCLYISHSQDFILKHTIARVVCSCVSLLRHVNPAVDTVNVALGFKVKTCFIP